jgi:hypothetical protein
VNLEGYISKGIEKTNSSKSQRTLVGMPFSATILTGLPIIEAVLVGAIHQALPAMFLGAANLFCGRIIFEFYQEATNCFPDRWPSSDHAVRVSSRTHSCRRSACRLALLE